MELLGSILLPEGISLKSLIPCDNTLIIGHTRNDQLLCIDTLTGEIRWTSREGDKHSLVSYADQEGILYSTCNNRTVKAIDPQTGDALWSLPVPAIPSALSSSFVTCKDLLIYHSASTVYAVNRVTKKRVWKSRIPGHIRMSELLVWKDLLFACSTLHGKSLFHRIDPTSGALTKSIEAELTLKDHQKVWATEERIWFCTEKDTIGSLDPVSGTIQEVRSNSFSEDNTLRPVQVKGFHCVGEEIWFRPDSLYYKLEKDGVYACNQSMQIRKVSSRSAGFDEKGSKQDQYIYRLDARHHCLMRFSLTGQTMQQHRLPRWSGCDMLVCMALLPDGGVVVAQQGGDENDNRQILYGIR